MTAYASIVTRTAWMGKDFGEELARRLFGDELVDDLPRNKKGKNAGKFKTEIEWSKVEKGGWVKDAPGEGNGHVERRVGKIVRARILHRHWDGKEEVLAQKEIVP